MGGARCSFSRPAGHIAPLASAQVRAAAERVARRAAETAPSPGRAGNYGLWNFDLGGPGAAKRRLDASAVGAVVSSPGAAEQAIHADAPHLFDDRGTLPGHYFNAFTVGGAAARAPAAGQTAFVPGSHDLGACAALTADDGALGARVAAALIRPRLEAGDVLLFDARILHFGLANTSGERRAVLYFNLTEFWYRDPKNWDDGESVFAAPRA